MEKIMKLIDTHCHLNKEYYENVETVIKEAVSDNVEYLIVSSCSPENWEENINLINKYKNVYLNISLHPEYGNEEIDYDLYLEKMKKIIKSNSKIIAIGEIGLDYHYDNTNKDRQKDLFIKQIMLAKEYKLPIVIHTRDATKDTIDILKKFNIKGIIHCFSGSLETAREYINMGFYLGIGGVVTFKNSKLKDVIKEIGLDSIVLETDSPYLSPIRGNKNFPKNIKIIAEYIASLLNISVEEVSKKTTLNVKKIYNIEF
ncbi:MAG: TatD family hydrolase [Clostridiales bacterium]|jgi:hydrolase, tatD family|nr:TatD family hydrolase [Clostridiales bacterium]